jgi:LDH2 family malate/lactate/ureidoglycolate dehydrogenase
MGRDQRAQDAAEETAASAWRIPVGKLTDLCSASFIAAGLPPEDAALASAALVEADLRGVPSHGVRLLPDYLARLRAGGLNPQPHLRVVREGAGTALLDGDHGLGQVVACRAMDLAIEKARACGIGSCAAFNSNHFGLAAFYALRAREQGMIGLATTNSVPVMPPPGGAAGRVGNTATAYALPTHDEPALVLDIAMSVAARSKIQLYAAESRPIPGDWALDQSGQPTTDAEAAAAGWLLPAGGHKGFGLALLWDALAGALSGARFGTAVQRPLAHEHTEIGHFMLAIDVRAFTPLAGFEQRIDRVVRDIRATPLLPGAASVHAPGEASAARRAEQLASGIALPVALVEALNAAAARLNVSARLAKQ